VLEEESMCLRDLLFDPGCKGFYICALPCSVGPVMFG